ncbi:hypothetical protein AWZ03_010739 [Drosophila navojoa]|uniref:Chitin-binding type-2 domain-containing protein n=2 Tax=Drosophila navojoa TaxID=7232 RepID=A0A484B422_DRONA|nr:hypothetical protein AWZ03_010739 [Drosophila navojoa]
MHRTRLYSIAVVVLTCLGCVWGDVFEECADSEPESFVASWQNCQSYVYCNGDDSILGECEDGQYFDPESGTCDDAENVKCFLDEVDEPSTEEGEETDEPETPAVDLDPTPPTMETPTQVDVVQAAPVVKPSCPITDDPTQVIFMPNNDSCTDYYLCYHGHAMQMQCTNQLHFNAKTGQCDLPENAHCALDQFATHKCLPHMTDFFPHPDKCSYFYYCIKGFLTLQQCPFYYGWDIERRSCVQLNVAKCYGNARRA